MVHQCHVRRRRRRYCPDLKGDDTTKEEEETTSFWHDDVLDLAWSLPLFTKEEEEDTEQHANPANGSTTTNTTMMMNSGHRALAFYEELLQWQDHRSRLTTLASSQQRRTKSRFKRQRSLHELPPVPLPKRTCLSTMTTTSLTTMTSHGSGSSSHAVGATTTAIAAGHSSHHYHNTTTTRHPSTPLLQGSEWDERILEYKQQLKSSAGDVLTGSHPSAHSDQFRLGILVSLTGRRARRVMRQSMKQLQKQRLLQANNKKHSTWQEAYRRTIPSRIGDYRRPKRQRLNFDVPAEKEDMAKTTLAPFLSKDMSEQNDRHRRCLRRVDDLWKVLLECARKIEEDAKDPSKPPVFLSQVMLLLDHANDLPPPEDALVTTNTTTSATTSDASDTESVTDMIDEINQLFWSLFLASMAARKQQAKLMDLWSEDAVDVDAVSKLLDQLHKQGTSKSVPGAASKEPVFLLDCLPEMKRQVQVVMEWQTRLETTWNTEKATAAASSSSSSPPSVMSSSSAATTSDQGELKNDDLSLLEELASEAKRTHGFRSKSLVLLEAKLEKAYQLRERINDWMQSSQTTSADGTQGSKETIKFTAAIVREVQRLKFSFPEATRIINFQRMAESWVERANIAIRSRISLEEICALIQRGQEMPLDLSEYLEKLQARARQAQDWLDRFEQRVPCSPSVKQSKVEWMSRIRQELCVDGEGFSHVELQELASEGSRIPVEIECVKLLQIELDARNWASKTNKWLPASFMGSNDASEDGEKENGNNNSDANRKKGKLEDLQDHLQKAAALRDRLELDSDEKKAWTLQGESELRALVKAAEGWLSKYNYLLEGDARRSSNTRYCLSIDRIRTVVEEANAIYCNLGAAHSKMIKLLNQAESWFDEHSELLQRCGIFVSGNGRELEEKKDIVQEDDKPLEMDEIHAAVEAAMSDVMVDLQEARELKSVEEKIKAWFEEATAAASGSGKRQRRGRKGSSSSSFALSVTRLEELIEEATKLPVDTSACTLGIQNQLQMIHQWQAGVAKAQEDILLGFTQLRDAVNEVYGLPADFVRDQSKDITMARTVESVVNGGVVKVVDEADARLPATNADEASVTETISTFGSDEGNFGVLSHFLTSENNVHALIRNFAKDADAACVDTPERELALKLEVVSRWFLGSMKYLECQRDVFDKRFFGAFDRFISEGRDLLKPDKTLSNAKDSDLSSRVRAAWECVVRDQLTRLEIILAERDRFVAWCSTAKKFLSEDKKLTIEKLREIAKKSSEYPDSDDLVKRVRDLEATATCWISSANKSLSSERKMAMEEAKNLLDEGEKIGVVSTELRTLRNGLKAARGWISRLKRCKLDQGATHVSETRDLLAEHENLIVAMPDEMVKLEQASKNYCICRRPYEGFMIGCDSCDEWFHGPCIGVTESKAGRVDKYVCPRCSISRVFKASACTIVGIIRKWSNIKDRRKARQVEAQKHQRKVRKESKELEALGLERTNLHAQLERILLQEKMGPHVSETSAASDTAIVGSGVDGNVFERSSALGPLQCEVTNESAGEGETHTDNSIIVVQEELPSKEQVDERLDAIGKSLEVCKSRLAALAEVAAARRNVEELEDANAAALKSWCLRVRSLVIVPSSMEKANDSRPKADGSMSAPMLSLVDEADAAGLDRFHDVKEVINAFKCLAWSMRATSVLSRQPTVSDVEELVGEAAELKLPDEKAYRMLRSLVQRANNWGNKVLKAIAPSPGEEKPYDVEMLKELANVGDDIPLCMPLEARLFTVIEDKGGRHCFCGGPSDGRFMLSCDKCDRWYHGHCVGVTNENIAGREEWKCQRCRGLEFTIDSLKLDEFHQQFDVELEKRADEDEHDELTSSRFKVGDWPPYGLLGSELAREALGKECSAIPDVQPSVTPSVCSSATGATALVNAPGNPQPCLPSSARAASMNDLPGLPALTCAVLPDILTFAASNQVSTAGLICGFPIPLYGNGGAPILSAGVAGVPLCSAAEMTHKPDPVAPIQYENRGTVNPTPSPASQLVLDGCSNGVNQLRRNDHSSCHYETNTGSINSSQTESRFQQDMMGTVSHDVLVAPVTDKCYD